MNPNSPKSEVDQRRLLLAVALSAGVLLVWQTFFSPAPVVGPPEKPAVVSTDAGATPPADPQAPAAAPAASTAPAAAPTQPQVLIEHRTIATLKTEGREAIELTNVGGQISAWTLYESQYLRRTPGEDDAPFRFVDDLPEKPEHGQFLPPLLDIQIAGQVVRGDYTASQTDAKSATLTWLDAQSGVRIVRQYALDPDTYRVDQTITLENTGAAPIDYDLSAFLRGAEDKEEATGHMFMPPVHAYNGVCKRAEDFERLTIDKANDEEEDRAFSDGVAWAGVDSRYFMNAVLPVEGEAEGCEMLPGMEAARISKAQTTDRLRYMTVRVDLVGGTIEPGAKVERKLAFYAGPKKLDALRAQTPSLSDTIDFGFFGVICVPMLFVMRTFFEWVGNWGLAIIFLTVLVKLMTLPLTHKQYKSMAAMKKVQPEMKALQAKYKDDKARQQQETMKLYRDHKVNPMAGCLPMILMMPIYFALYRTIYSAVELYQADFGLWITDLSAMDPYYITPVLLGLTMLIQMRLNPNTGDAVQQKVMMYVMPVMFTGMMLFLPSGLVLYIFVNTVLGIAQQYFLLKQVGAPVAA